MTSPGDSSFKQATMKMEWQAYAKPSTNWLARMRGMRGRGMSLLDASQNMPWIRPNRFRKPTPISPHSVPH